MLNPRGLGDSLGLIKVARFPVATRIAEISGQWEVSKRLGQYALQEVSIRGEKDYGEMSHRITTYD